MAKPLISVIIPAFNRSEQLHQALLSLREQDWPHDSAEQIVIDNGSTDDTPALVKGFQTPYHLTYIRQNKSKRYECARPKNAGAAAAKGDILVFLDSDKIVPRQFLSSHARFHGMHSRLAVAGKVLYLTNSGATANDVVGGAINHQGLGKFYLKGASIRRFVDFSGNLPQYLRQWELCAGGNFSIRRQTFMEAGSFDEGIDGDHAGGEDLAYHLRLHSLGVRLVYSRFSTSFHQKNIPLRYSEAPDYFEARKSAVQATRERACREYLSPSELQQSEQHRAIKRSLEQILVKYNGRLTFQAKRSIACRLGPILAARGKLPLVSVILVSDSGPAELRHLLESLENELDWRAFEVLVVDPVAPFEIEASTALPFADIVTQITDVKYCLRYFPARVGQDYREGHSIRELQLADELQTLNMRSIAEEKPLGIVCLPATTSAGTELAARIREVSASLKELVGLCRNRCTHE